MKISEAKKEVNKSIIRLSNAGIKGSIKASKSREIPYIVERYRNLEGRLPAYEWDHVTFFPKSEEEEEMIYNESIDLSKKGIVFDTGACSGERDWEIDWSLHVVEENADDLIGKKIVKSLLDEIGEPEEAQIKYIDIKEFREKGYLQELNRSFLHPLGLALEVVVEEDGSESLGGIWDYRNDCEGIYYDIEHSNQERINAFREKLNFINKEWIKRCANRIRTLGFDVENIPKRSKISEMETSRIP